MPHDQFNELIVHLIAIKEYAKDIHYKVRKTAFYGQHLLADRVYEPIDGFIDSVKENCLLFEGIAPLRSSEYLQRAIELIPALTENDQQNWDNMRTLHIDTLIYIEKMNELSPGEANLIGNIAETLNNNLGLFNLQCDRIGQ